jgi:FG-GAP-like repeat
MSWLRRLAAIVILLLGGAAGAAAATVIRINFPTKDIVYDPHTQRIYASVPGSAGTLGNTITVIDPVTGALGVSVFVGSEPGRLALSDDGQYLYVALDGSAAVVRVHVPTMTPGLQFSLGSDSFNGAKYAGDMAVLPGNPNAVAISLRFQGVSPDHAGVAIYDDGVQRPTATPGHTGSTAIEFGESSATLYGNSNGFSEFRSMAVTASGVSVADVTPGLIPSGTDIAFAGGIIYSTNGRIIDPAARVMLGTFSGPPSGPVAPDASLQRTFFIQGSILRAFDNSTFTELGTLTIAGVGGTPARLVRLDSDGLAFNTTGIGGGQVVLVRTSLVNCSPALCDQSVPPGPLRPYDLDTDARADVGVVAVDSGNWTILRSTGGLTQQLWGCPDCDDIPVPGDYDGDGKLDVAVYRRATGEWYIRKSTTTVLRYVLWGCATCADVPVAADFDGDRKTDIAVYRRTTGDWFVLQSSTNTGISLRWGCAACADIPVPADYDGDEKADIAVYRTSTGEWLVRRSTDGGLTSHAWGCVGCSDIPVPADFDGDHKADIAVYRSSTGEWFVLRSTDGNSQRVSWGCPGCGDIPVPADYDGDGFSDVAVFRGTTATWFITRSTGAPSVTTTLGSPNTSIPIERPLAVLLMSNQ